MKKYIIRNKFGYFCGMVYHSECGWHCGFQYKPDINDKEIVQYGSMVQANQQIKFFEETFHEKELTVEVVL